MIIHSKARAIIFNLCLPSPIQKYFSNLSWDIDLSHNINPYFEDAYGAYPDIQHEDLKKTYLKTILSVPPSSKSTSKNLSPHLSSKNLLFTVGSTEAIDLLIRTFLEPNQDKVCILTPTFPAYEHAARLHNLTIETLPLEGTDCSSFNKEELIRLNPKMVFLCNPNNPTGTLLNPGLIEDVCSSFNGFVVVDEAYIEFSDTPSSVFSLSSHKNLIVLRTLSKAWGMAGVRCGCIIADEPILNALRYVQLPFGLSSPSQEHIKSALHNPAKAFSSWKKIKEARESLSKNLSSLNGVSHVYKSHGNFLLLVLKDFQKVNTLLQNHGIYVMNCSQWIPSSLRVSIGNEVENQKFLNLMKNV